MSDCLCFELWLEKQGIDWQDFVNMADDEQNILSDEYLQEMGVI